MNEKKIALLIDAENTSAKYADNIIRYLEKQGVVISKRIYGDFINNRNVKAWNSKAMEYEMQQVPVLTTSAGKNASDIVLVIDAMDLLHRKNVDTFCIVTSDGDFTSLIKRIREDGVEVIGIGKEDASKRLEKVCDNYLLFDELEGLGGKLKEKTNLFSKLKKVTSSSKGKKENTQETFKEKKKQTISKEKNTENRTFPQKVKKTVEKSKSVSESKVAESKNGTSIQNIKMEINHIIQQDENAGKNADLGGIKSRLQLKYPGFNEKDYGYKSIRELIEKETKFQVCQEDRHIFVTSGKKSSTAGHSDLETVTAFILKMYPKKIIGLHEIATLGQKIHNEFPNFNCKDYGYKKLSSLLEEIGINVY